MAHAGREPGGAPTPTCRSSPTARRRVRRLRTGRGEPGRQRGDDTTDTIREHLRADPPLTDEAAERIAGLVTNLYRSLVPTGQTEVHLRASTTFTPQTADRLAGVLAQLQNRLLADPTLGTEPGWNPA